MSKSPAIFLDRDGVIIENRSNYVRRWEDVAFFPAALLALEKIQECPYKIIMVTNQSAVGRGILSLETAVSLNNRIIDTVRRQNGRIDAAYICPDPPGVNSPCRKPEPGMLIQAAREHDLDLANSMMIGDALSDVQAGQAAGVKTAVLLLTGRGVDQYNKPERKQLPTFLTFNDLAAALEALV